MSWQEWLLENFAGDLEYHPKRGYVYLGLAILSATPWFFLPSETQFTMLPLVFVFGGVGLFGKAIYLFRKSSERLGLTIQDEMALEETAKRKKLPSFPSEVAQVVQDFGTGVLLLAPFLGRNPDKFPAILIGACVFALGWSVRWLVGQTKPME